MRGKKAPEWNEGMEEKINKKMKRRAISFVLGPAKGLPKRLVVIRTMYLKMDCMQYESKKKKKKVQLVGFFVVVVKKKKKNGKKNN